MMHAFMHAYMYVHMLKKYIHICFTFIPSYLYKEPLQQYMVDTICMFAYGGFANT